MTTDADGMTEAYSVVQERRTFPYFQTMHGAFLAAEEAGGGSVMRTYSIAGHIIQLQFAGPALVPQVSPALAHLAIDNAGPADFTVCVWDSESTGVSLPPARLTPRERARSLPATDDRERVRASFRGKVGAEDELAAVGLFDPSQRLAIHWFPSADISPWDKAGPLLVIFYWILELSGIQVVHAAAVGTEKGGLLLTGRSGSGKSTTTLSCVVQGLAIAGDDVVALATQPSPRAWSLYSSARLNADSIDLVPGIRRAVTNPDRVIEDKALIYLCDHYPDLLRPSLPIDVIVVPQVTRGPETRLVPASRAESLSALAPTSLFQVPDATGGTFRALADFVRRVPSFRLEIGAGSDRAPLLLAELLDNIGSYRREPA